MLQQIRPQYRCNMTGEVSSAAALAVVLVNTWWRASECGL